MENIKEKDEVNNYQYFLEKSNDNKHIIKIKNNNRTFYIGSKYATQRDIDKFMEQIDDFNVSTVFLVFGLGAGEHIFELLKKIGKENKVLIIEPYKKIVELSKIGGYYDEIVKDKRVSIVEFNSINIMEVLSSFIDEININNINFTVYANYNKIFKYEFDEFYRRLNEFLLKSIINMNTNISFSEQFFKCFIKNIKHTLDSVLINEFRNKFKNIPAVVVSAGPSLEKNIELLKEVQEKFIIITGIRTVSSLSSKGIKPHFVCVVDPTETMYNVAKNSLNCKSAFAFCECTNYKIVEEYKGKKIFFQEGINLKDVTPELLNVQVDSLWAGGSVAHTCTALGKYLGCNPIIFVGQDFAYTNDKYHAESASDDNNIINPDNTIFVDDINGEKVRTSKLLNTYKKNMEQFIKVSKDTLFINSTEGGANMMGTKIQPLGSVINEYSQSYNFNLGIEDLISKSNNINKNEVLNKIKQILDNLEKIKEECVSALNFADQFLDCNETENEKNIEILLRKISDINKIIYKAKFIENMLKPTIYSVLMNPDYLEKINESKIEREYRLAKQVKNLYEGIVKAIDKSIPYVKECIEELN
ncbi:MAG: hypothetical protein K0R54_3306 [Clostridiaceae bacterium]|jgi:hypothetical protein|nr:hypothetical protein [Clostridiaceae bacterium]